MPQGSLEGHRFGAMTLDLIHSLTMTYHQLASEGLRTRTHVMFTVDRENKVPSSSLFPEIKSVCCEECYSTRGTCYKRYIRDFSLLYQLLRIVRQENAICSGYPSKIQGLDKEMM